VKKNYSEHLEDQQKEYEKAWKQFGVNRLQYSLQPKDPRFSFPGPFPAGIWIPKSIFPFFNIDSDANEDVKFFIEIHKKKFWGKVNCIESDNSINKKRFDNFIPGLKTHNRMLYFEMAFYKLLEQYFPNWHSKSFYKDTKLRLNFNKTTNIINEKGISCVVYDLSIFPTTEKSVEDMRDAFFPEMLSQAKLRSEKEQIDHIDSRFKNLGPFIPSIHTQKMPSSEMNFGHIEGIEEGLTFTNRKELALSGIHRPPQAGIWGRQGEGSASIVLSGGYADDIDEVDYILYTGQGGQDIAGRRQIKDQEFTLGNRGLQLNHEYNLPVRVTRRYRVLKGGSEFRYRYDGLYFVTNYERVKGKEGFLVCRFHLQKDDMLDLDNTESTSSSPGIYEYSGNRLKRNVKFAEKIKEFYNSTCQVCKVFLKTPIEGLGVSEAAHIKALGRPHNGPDTKANMLCLCPNHHAQFDRYTFYIEPETLEIVGLDEYKGKSILLNNKHKVNIEYFEYQKLQHLKNKQK